MQLPANLKAREPSAVLSGMANVSAYLAAQYSVEMAIFYNIEIDSVH
jgi:hypothetical protein